MGVLSFLNFLDASATKVTDEASPEPIIRSIDRSTASLKVTRPYAANVLKRWRHPEIGNERTPIAIYGASRDGFLGNVSTALPNRQADRFKRHNRVMRVEKSLSRVA